MGFKNSYESKMEKLGVLVVDADKSINEVAKEVIEKT